MLFPPGNPSGPRLSHCKCDWWFSWRRRRKGKRIRRYYN